MYMSEEADGNSGGEFLEFFTLQMELDGLSNALDLDLNRI